MPLRSAILTKRWSTVNLPILPFLAPRVSKPWPCRASRVQTATQATRAFPEIVGRDYDNWPQTDTREGQTLDKGYSNILGDERHWGNGIPSSEGVHHEDDNLRRLEISHNFVISGHEAEKTEGETVATTVDEEFRKKYEEIWGARAKKRNSEGEELSPIRRVLAELKIKHQGAISPSTKTRVTKNNHRRISVTSPQVNRRVTIARRRREMHIRSLDQREVRRAGIRNVRTKWVGIAPEAGYNFTPFFRFWHRAFAILNLRHDKFMEGRARPRLIGVSGIRFSQMVKKELILLSSKALQEKWEGMPVDLRIQMWPDLMLTALEHHPAEALKVVAATYNDPLPPAYSISDSLEYIISHYLTRSDDTGPDSAQNLQKTITLLLRHKPEHHLQLSQKSIFLLMSNLDDAHMKELYRDMVELGHPLHLNTLIQFASRLAKSRDTALGFEVLKKISLKEVDFASDRMMSLCSSLLFRSHGAPDNSTTGSERFQFMLSQGIVPNTITYNILIQNALLGGDPETGWQMHGLMLENGVKPDGYTYSILLNDAKLRMDVSAIRSIIGYLRERKTKSPHVVTDVLHTIMLLHQQEERTSKTPLRLGEKRQPVFERMLQVYCEHFNVNPLARLIPQFREGYPYVQDFSSNVGDVTAGLDPPGPTLAVMISGLLNDLDSQATKTLYNHFCQLILSGRPDILELASSTHIWNIFLLALGRFPDRLFDCPKVISKMISGELKLNVMSTPEDSNDDGSSTAHRDKPSVPSATSSLNTTGHNISLATTTGSCATKHVETEDTDDPNHLSGGTTIQSDSQSETSLPRIYYTYRRRMAATQTVRSTLVHYKYPQPDIYTWSILLKIFTDHGQMHAADKVISVMQARKIKPNQITWTTLAFGYSRAQNTKMLADTVSRMEQAGVEPNEITMKALFEIRDQRKMMDALNRKQADEILLPNLNMLFTKALKNSLNKDQKEEEEYIQRQIDPELRKEKRSDELL